MLFDRHDDGRPRQLRRALRSGTDGSCYDVARSDAPLSLTATFAALHADGVLEVSDVPRTHGGASPRRPQLRAVATTPARRRGASQVAARPRPSLLVLLARRRRSPRLVRHGTGRRRCRVDGTGAADEGPPADEAASDDPFAGLAGPTFGTAVHEALEAAVARPAGSSFDDVLRESLRAALRARSLPVSDAVEDGLVLAASAPIGGGRSIAQLEPDDAATELRFSLPVADGVDLAAVAACLAVDDADGPFVEWAARTAASPHSPRLAQSLVGSIDLVTTLGTRTRYAVVDYKTNVCDAPRLHVVAVSSLRCRRRTTRSRPRSTSSLCTGTCAGGSRYDPSTHLGGAHYLFLRGMRPGTTTGCPPGRCQDTSSRRSLTCSRGSGDRGACPVPSKTRGTADVFEPDGLVRRRRAASARERRRRRPRLSIALVAKAVRNEHVCVELDPGGISLLWRDDDDGVVDAAAPAAGCSRRCELARRCARWSARAPTSPATARPRSS